MAPRQIVIQTEDGRVFYDMSASDNPCDGCGVCCRHYRVSFYQGETDDYPGGLVPAALTAPITPFRVAMRGTEAGHGRCVAFQDDGRCGIYAQRPSPCREFPVFLDDGSWNPECIRLRSLYGVPLPPEVQTGLEAGGANVVPLPPAIASDDDGEAEMGGAVILPWPGRRADASDAPDEEPPNTPNNPNTPPMAA